MADAGTDLAQVTLPTGESVGYQLQGGTVTAPTVNGPTARYRDILPQTDLELTTFDAGVKETLVLRSPEAASSWVFPLRLKGLTPRLTAQGSVELLNADGKAVAWFPHGSMQDSKVDPKSGAPAESDKVTFEVVTLDGAPALKVVADQAWLRDPARQYPVRMTRPRPPAPPVTSTSTTTPAPPTTTATTCRSAPTTAAPSRRARSSTWTSSTTTACSASGSARPA
ncbi:hypothetical protein JNW88_08400 [Micromonospora sp. ATA32]|nr:hypothetical protein [Micromonospora sp. ATA32]